MLQPIMAPQNAERERLKTGCTHQPDGDEVRQLRKRHAAGAQQSKRMEQITGRTRLLIAFEQEIERNEKGYSSDVARIEQVHAGQAVMSRK